MALARADTNGGAILYDPQRLETPTPVDFEPALLEAAGRVSGRASGRGEVWFVRPRGAAPAAERWVLRHYRRGGLVAAVARDTYLWQGEAATRGFAELTLLDALNRAGLPVPAPVAARYQRRGLGYCADLLTVAIPGVATLAQRLNAAAGAPLPGPLLHAVGTSIRRLHQAGVWHADLNAHNVLIDGEGRAWLIDFDRARRRPPGPWRAANLRRLRRSLDKLCAAEGRTLPATDWRALLDGYGGV